MIVRLMSEGQYRVPDDVVTGLNEIDNAAVAAVESGDGTLLRQLLESIGRVVKERGERLDDADLSASDLIVPPADLTLAEARELFTGDGLIPDLPA